MAPIGRVRIPFVFLLGTALWVVAQPIYGPLGEVRIALSAPSTPPFAFSENDEDRLALGGHTLKDAIGDLLADTPLRVDFPPELDGGKLYDFSVRVAPVDRSRVPELFRQAIELQFGLTITHENRLTDVYVLTAPHAAEKLQVGHCCTDDGMTIHLAVANTPGNDNSLEAREATMKFVATTLESPLGRPVLDETDLNGRYTFACKSAGQGGKGVMRMLQQCGLALVPDRRIVEVVVVRQRH